MIHPNIKARDERIKWFAQDRFGLFIHWGIYAIPARGEWLRYYEKTTDEEYNKYFDQFNPTRYNPKEWAHICKAAGMKYAVLTAKHHDGFCLFDSKYTDFKSTNTKCGRDLVREFLDAFRDEGLKVGLYYSLLDWHQTDFPSGDGITHTGNPQTEPEPNLPRYLEYMHNQIEELLTGYGKIDIMWFDYSYGEMIGEAWGATKIMNMVRKHQPHLITDNRLEGAGGYHGSIETDEPSIFAGDFMCPEHIIPFDCPRTPSGRPIPWETCTTLGGGWGYKTNDKDWIPAKFVVQDLVDCVSKGGNLLLNVGPNAFGEFPWEATEILLQVGRWLRINGESIYGCGMSEYTFHDFGRYTQNGNKLYLHILEKTGRPIRLEGLLDKYKTIRYLQDGAEVVLIKPDSFHGPLYRQYPGDVFFFLGSRGEEKPDDWDTVIEITLKE